MTFYELIIIIRQDVSSVEVDKIAEDFMQIIKDNGGNIVKTEYWGLRSLAYEIQNNKKGHYYFMGIQATNPGLKELDRRIKLSESVIRNSLVKVEEISKDPSPVLRAKNSDQEDTIDVTISRDNV